MKSRNIVFFKSPRPKYRTLISQPYLTLQLDNMKSDVANAVSSPPLPEKEKDTLGHLLNEMVSILHKEDLLPILQKHLQSAGFYQDASIALINACEKIRAYEKIESQLAEIKAFQAKLEEENLYLQEQIKIDYNHNELVGTSTEMKKVFDLISRVAETDSTVLLQGETGTGKELIARALHTNSKRKDHLMVKVNCAAIPANLIESELFGHEKGSFTGATDRRIGKFELAHNSTLFLDEIGEMPPDLQVKLLRAIQEREIERVGGKGPIRIDV